MREEVLARLPIGVAVVDAESGAILEANGRLCEWLGQSSEALRALTFAELLPMGQRLFWANTQAMGAHIDGEAAEVMYDLARADGTALPALVTVGALDANRHIYLVSRAERRKRYEEQLREAKRRAEEAARFRRDFVNTVSHEIRTPIHAITNLVSFLDPDGDRAGGGEGGVDQREVVEELRSSSAYLLRLVNDVLDLAKAEEGKIVLQPEPTDVGALCEAAMRALAPTAADKGLHLEARVGLASGRHYALDAGKLRQVLTNLIGNGIKFTERGGVTLAVEEVTRERDSAGVEAGGVTLQFRVTDSGPGVSPEDAARIFEPFEQTGKKAGATGSTGLGLAISRGLVETFGGTLTLESVVGEGSTFAFTMPTEVDESAAPAPVVTPLKVSAWKTAEPEPPDRPLVGMRVLHADDNATNRFIARRHLRKLGVVLTEATDGVEATAAAAAADFDAILLDVRMPNMDGPAAAAAIRTFPHHRRTPLFAVSAGSTSRDGARLGAPFEGLLPKPYTIDELRELLLGARGTHSSAIDLGELRAEVFADEEDDDELSAFLAIIREDLRSHRASLVEAVRAGDSTAVGDLHHKLQTAVRTLSAHVLNGALDEARAGGVTAEGRERLALSLDGALGEVIGALDVELAGG